MDTTSGSAELAGGLFKKAGQAFARGGIGLQKDSLAALRSNRRDAFPAAFLIAAGYHDTRASVCQSLGETATKHPGRADHNCYFFRKVKKI